MPLMESVISHHTQADGFCVEHYQWEWRPACQAMPARGASGRLIQLVARR